MEMLMNGKMRLSEQEYMLLPDQYRYYFRMEWQTNLHGIWVSGYLFPDSTNVRRVFIER